MPKANKHRSRQPRRRPTELPLSPNTPASVPALDAALLALCGEFRNRQVEIDRWNEDDGIAWDEGDAANVKWWEALRQIVDTPAQTMEGVKAKAMVLIFTVPGVTDEPEIDGELGLSLAADLMSMGAVA